MFIAVFIYIGLLLYNTTKYILFEINLYKSLFSKKLVVRDRGVNEFEVENISSYMNAHNTFQQFSLEILRI